MILVKLGGSVITDKAQYQSVRLDVLTRLCREIVESGKDVVVVHGAGSFGHIMAHDHRLAEGHLDDGQIPALATVSRDVRQLNLMVMDAMLSVGLMPISLPPSACVLMKGGEIKDLGAERIRSYISLGASPVMFGDVALDESMGFSICSGDQIIESLAKEISPERVVFVSDVDGIMDRDPADPSSRVVEVVRPEDVEVMDFHARVKDVTGGIRKKLKSMLGLCTPERECLIINGTVPGRLLAALNGERVLGTRVELDTDE